VDEVRIALGRAVAQTGSAQEARALLAEVAAD
jgi:hypothetical protein